MSSPGACSTNCQESSVPTSLRNLIRNEEGDLLDVLAKGRDEFAGQVTGQVGEVGTGAGVDVDQHHDLLSLQRGAGRGDGRLEGLEEVKNGHRVAPGQTEQARGGERDRQ